MNNLIEIENIYINLKVRDIKLHTEKIGDRWHAFINANEYSCDAEEIDNTELGAILKALRDYYGTQHNEFIELLKDIDKSLCHNPYTVVNAYLRYVLAETKERISKTAEIEEKLLDILRSHSITQVAISEEGDDIRVIKEADFKKVTEEAIEKYRSLIKEKLEKLRELYAKGKDSYNVEFILDELKTELLNSQSPHD